MSGRLDNETLNELRAFPDSVMGHRRNFPGGGSGERFFRRIPGPFEFWGFGF